MKIAYLANVRFPSERAHAVQIFHMCKAFSENGAELTLFVNKIGKGDAASIREYFATGFNFKIVRLTRGPFLPKFKPSYYLGEIIFALSFLISQRKNIFDVVYSRHEWIVWFLSFFIKNEKLIWESHEAKFNFPARCLLKKDIKTVVISEGIFDFYKSKEIPDSQMLVAHDGIDESFFSPVESKVEARQRLCLPQDEKIAMYIGGFDKWKGVETFFKASELLHEVSFVAIGGREEEVEKFSRIYPRVTFLGQRPYAELKDNQQAADVLVIPNTAKNALSAEYTSPLKLFAHMVSGVPMVLTKIPSLTKVIREEYVTFIEPDSEEVLAAGLFEVLGSLHHKKVLAKRLRDSSKRYTWNVRAKSIFKNIC